MSLLDYYFGIGGDGPWYEGAVYSNLVASVLCGGFAWWRVRVQMRRHRDRSDQTVKAALNAHHAETTATLAAHREQLATQQAEHAAALADQTAALHLKIDALTGDTTTPREG